MADCAEAAPLWAKGLTAARALIPPAPRQFSEGVYPNTNPDPKLDSLRPSHGFASASPFQRRRRRRRCLPAFSAQAFVLLDLLLMIVAFAAVRSGDAVLVSSSFGLHYLAALAVSFCVFFLFVKSYVSLFLSLY